MKLTPVSHEEAWPIFLSELRAYGVACNVPPGSIEAVEQRAIAAKDLYEFARDEETGKLMVSKRAWYPVKLSEIIPEQLNKMKSRTTSRFEQLRELMKSMSDIQ